jgi:phage terminase Nu1 subunit (DNA packaging protein)
MASKPGEIVNKKELAKLFGVSVQAVDGWINRDCPVEEAPTGPGTGYRFDTAKVAAWRSQVAVDEATANIEPEGEGGESYAEAQRRKEIAVANLRELELSLKKSELVSRQEVEDAAFTRARIERDALLNWPQRIAPFIAAALNADINLTTVTLEMHIREFLEQEPEHKPLFN